MNKSVSPNRKNAKQGSAEEEGAPSAIKNRVNAIDVRKLIYNNCLTNLFLEKHESRTQTFERQ